MRGTEQLLLFAVGRAILTLGEATRRAVRVRNLIYIQIDQCSIYQFVAHTDYARIWSQGQLHVCVCVFVWLRPEMIATS